MDRDLDSNIGSNMLSGFGVDALGRAHIPFFFIAKRSVDLVRLSRRHVSRVNTRQTPSCPKIHSALVPQLHVLTGSDRSASKPKYVVLRRSQHSAIDLHFIKEKLSSTAINVQLIQLADCSAYFHSATCCLKNQTLKLTRLDSCAMLLCNFSLATITSAPKVCSAL